VSWPAIRNSIPTFPKSGEVNKTGGGRRADIQSGSRRRTLAPVASPAFGSVECFPNYVAAGHNMPYLTCMPASLAITERSISTCWERLRL
jgi:hypothetical protein